MAFGRLGSLGTGFGRLGAGRHVGTAAAAVGGAALLTGETDGFATDFTYATDASRVAVKAASVTTSYALDSFYANGGTSPKQVWDVAGTLGWAPHNMCLQSQTFDNASWSKSNTTVTADAIAAPDGSSTADKLVNANTTNTNHQAIGANITGGIVGQVYTAQVWAKAAEWSWIAMEEQNIGTHKTYFDLGNGAVGTVNAAHSSATITAGSNGWYLCRITWTGTAATQLVSIYLQTANAQGIVVGVIGSGVYLWGAQFNKGSEPTAYLPTTTAARYGLAVDYDLATHAAKGLLVELAASNLLLNNAALSTQSVTVSAVAYTLSFWGTGTITLSGVSTAGPLVGTGANDRVSLTFTPTAGSLTCTVTGTVTRAQLETGTVATSPIPTFAATATRAADNYTFLLSTIPALGSAYSLYERFATPVIANARYAVALTEGVGSEISGFVANTTARLAVVDGGVAVGAIVGPTLVANTPVPAAARIKLNDCAMSVAGGAAAFDTTVTLPTPTEVRFGNIGSNAVATASFYIEKLVIVPRGWSDAELVTKSAS